MKIASRTVRQCPAFSTRTCPGNQAVANHRSEDVASSSVANHSNEAIASSSFVNHLEPRPFEEIPGPKSIPVLGTLWKYLPYVGEYSFDRLHWNGLAKLRQFGPLVREEIVPGENVVWVFDPADIETVFRSEGRYPQRRSHLAVQKHRGDRVDVYNSGGLLPTNGPDWWRLRRVFQKGLSSPRNVKSYLPMVDEVIEEFLDQIKTNVPQPEDFLPELSRLYVELICIVAFDTRLNALSASERDPRSRSTRLMNASFMSTSCIMRTDNGPQLWRYFQTPLYRKLSQALEYIEKVCIEMVNKRAEEMKNKTSMDDDVSLLELYLSSNEIDMKDVVGMAADMMLAGIDTTTYTSSFALYHLATNPATQDNLYAEAASLLANQSSPVTNEVLSNATYTKAVLKETHRLNPISVGIGRILAQDAVLSGYLVPKDTVVVTQNQVTCRLPEHFSKPDCFIPERWVKGGNAYTPVNPYLVLPFGHGPRSCIARRLAEQNMLALLLKLVRRYKVGWEGGSLDAFSYLINKPDQPILLTFQPR